MRLTVLSYNIHKGFTPTNINFVLGEIKQSIDEVHADVVFLQEVIGEHELHRQYVTGWPETSQFEFLADKVWHHYAYGKNAVYSSGHHGNAILSKFPIVEWSNTNISTNRFEQRGFLHARVLIPQGAEVGDQASPSSGEGGRHVSLICVHLNLLERARMKQIQQLAEYVRVKIDPQEPLVIAGDFNDWSGRVSHALEKELGLQEAYKALHGAYAKSYPAFWPQLRLDRVLFRGFRALRAERLHGEPWKDLSDHIALDAELELL